MVHCSMYGCGRENESLMSLQAAGMEIPSWQYSNDYFLVTRTEEFLIEIRMCGHEMWVVEAVEGQETNPRRLQLSSSLRKQAIRRVQEDAPLVYYCRFRPLPLQQEEAMIAMKKLFGYLLDEGALVLVMERGFLLRGILHRFAQQI